MHLFKSIIQDLDTSLISALPDNIELILLGDFNVNFTGSNLNIDKAMKRKLIQVTNSHELDQLINNTAVLSVAVTNSSTNSSVISFRTLLSLKIASFKAALNG